MSTFKHAFNRNKNEMVTWIDAMRSHPFNLATDVLQAALRVRDGPRMRDQLALPFSPKDSVQDENMEYSQKEEKWDIYHYLHLTHLFIYIYHTLVGPLDLMGQSSKLG